MLISYSYMNIKGRIWGHPMTSWMRFHHKKYFFLHNLGRSFHIWYQIEAACNILVFSIWPPFWRYSKLFLLEEILEVNHNRTMSHNQCCISFSGGGGGIAIGIGDVTLVRMFKSLIRMTHYFSSKLNVLGISKYILLLLDILATIQFLFHHFCPSIKRARIFINCFDLLIMKNAVRFRSLWYFTQLMAMYFYILCENFKQIRSVVFAWNAFKISTLYGL